VSLHWILTLTHDGYGKATSLSNIASHLSGSRPSPDRYSIEKYYRPENSTHLLVDRRANATFVILARNSNLDGAVRSVREIEDRFNQYYMYPYVFLNEEPFTDEFKK
ncbi:glycosyltransferase family 15 protein, partial [Amanita muscaria Koide BX008]